VIEFIDTLVVCVRQGRPPAFATSDFKRSRQFDAFYPIENAGQNADAYALVLEAYQVLYSVNKSSMDRTADHTSSIWTIREVSTLIFLQTNLSKINLHYLFEELYTRKYIDGGSMDEHIACLLDLSQRITSSGEKLDNLHLARDWYVNPSLPCAHLAQRHGILSSPIVIRGSAARAEL
jgi:hypothetical protein